MDGTIGKKYLEDYLGQTDLLFKNYLDRKIEEARRIGALPAEILTSFAEIARKGKKIRGSLVVLGYEAAGGQDKQAILDASLCMELTHSGLLVHDDIQDRDTVRRGLPTIHKRYEDVARKLNLGELSAHYGISLGINAGISAYYLAFEKLLSANFSPEVLVKASKLYADYILRVTYGQALDVSNIFVNNINKDELLNILKYKTAEYTGVLPLLIGATLAGKDDREYMSNLCEYGLCLGWAFQIQDDILGTFGEVEKLGKPVGTDIREGKVTLLMLHLAQHGTPEQKEFQKKVLGNKNVTEDEIRTMQQILKDSGSYDYVVKLGLDYVDKGEKYILKITDEPIYQAIFRSLLHFMMNRAV